MLVSQPLQLDHPAIQSCKVCNNAQGCEVHTLTLWRFRPLLTLGPRHLLLQNLDHVLAGV